MDQNRWLRPGDRIAIEAALGLSLFYWFPFMFVVGGCLVGVSGNARVSRLDHPRWFVAWIVALALVLVGAAWTTFWLVAGPATI